VVQNNDKVKIKANGQEFELPSFKGSEGECALDITELRAKGKCITFDPGYGNTGSCTSDITFIDGEKGILRYRGIPIEQLAEKSSFVETSYLLIYGKLPNINELDQFSKNITVAADLPKELDLVLQAASKTAHPMAVLSAVTSILSGCYPASSDPKKDEEEIGVTATHLLSKVRTIAAYTYKGSLDEAFVPPNKKLAYAAEFLNMMFSTSKKPYRVDDDIVKALDLLLILHADHEQNCSTSTVRLVGSSRSNLFASISAGVSALWGPWHGGANQEVMEMLDQIHHSGKGIDDYIRLATDPKVPIRLSGFGHRVYKTFDPRAQVIKNAYHRLINKLGVHDPLLEIALKLEAAALKNEFFISRSLYPNVDFYSGLIYKMIGIPTNMFTVMFAIGRLPGWIAHWKEMREFKPPKIGRPRQVYTGPVQTDYKPIEQRK
jgi:citrate synthase